MNVKQVLHEVLGELSHTIEALDEQQLEDLERRIASANKVFVAGAGRSGMMIRGLAMRLMHMGYTAYVVGETVTPAAVPGDLLIVASGSGSTGTLTAIATKAKQKIGCDVALITTQPDSPIGRLADCVVEVPAVSTKVAGYENGPKSVQLGSNTFEQSVLLIGDAIVIDLIAAGDHDANNEQLMRLHANLE